LSQDDERRVIGRALLACGLGIMTVLAIGAGLVLAASRLMEI
jgi:hypothetical protein